MIALFALLSCKANSSDKFMSPSKGFYYVKGVYDINTRKIDRSKLGFVLYDSSGRRIESADLSEAGVQNIAISWHNTNDTLFLNMGRNGVLAYRVGTFGTHRIQMDSPKK